MDNLSYDEDNISNKFVRDFWILVLIFNIGIFLFSLGIMLIGFQKKVDTGFKIILAGIIALIYGIYRYKKCKENITTT